MNDKTLWIISRDTIAIAYKRHLALFASISALSTYTAHLQEKPTGHKLKIQNTVMSIS